MKNNDNKRGVINHIAVVDDLLLITHKDPDGDALGSILGLGACLKKMNKRVQMVCTTDPLPATLSFLPGIEYISPIIKPAFDAAIFLDCSRVERAGLPKDALPTDTQIINIDHHEGSMGFGNSSWIVPSASSTSELVHSLLSDMDCDIDINTAVCLLTGIVTDTGCFRFSTDHKTLSVAADLMQSGAELTLITENAFARKPLGLMKVFGKALDRLHEEKGMAWSSIATGILVIFRA